MKINRIHKIGFLVTACIACLIWGYNYLKGENLLVDKNEYYAVFDEIPGIDASTPVTLQGYKIGQVREIKFDYESSQRFVLKIGIEEEYPLPRNSTAVVYSADIMGDKAIKILLGDSDELLNNNDTLQSDFEKDIITKVEEKIEPITKNVDNALLQIDSTLQAVQLLLNEENREKINESIDGLNNTMQHLETTSANLNQIVANDKEKISAIIDNLNHTSASFRAVGDSLQAANLAQTITNANNSLAELQALLAAINAGEGTLGKLAQDESLYQNLDSTAYHLSQLIEDLKANPNRYVHFSIFGGKDK